MKAWNDQPGTSAPLGATVCAAGVNFSVFSKDATGVELLLFDDAAAVQPSRVVKLEGGDHRTYHYWHVFVPDLGPGQVYAIGRTGRSSRPAVSGSTRRRFSSIPMASRSPCRRPTIAARQSGQAIPSRLP